MGNEHAGIKISADEYFERQKAAEKTCKNKIKHLIIQAVIFLALSFFFLMMTEWVSAYFIIWYLFVFICIFMAFGSIILIPKAIRYYKLALERIEEYMLTGGIVIEIPKEDYEKFDIFKSKKEKFKAKSLNQMKKDEKKAELNRQKELEQQEYEKRVEEEFQKQFYPENEQQDE